MLDKKNISSIVFINFFNQVITMTVVCLKTIVRRFPWGPMSAWRLRLLPARVISFFSELMRR